MKVRRLRIDLILAPPADDPDLLAIAQPELIADGIIDSLPKEWWDENDDVRILELGRARWVQGVPVEYR